ncbi:hypothetical protein LCGC14_1658360 [marine sediment metagenome]|uniref:Uncharacterized protein n=1 Tax=marine sediment metagenome TaxID=412755 RepID=A0A0F9IHB8_9ZZZZ
MTDEGSGMSGEAALIKALSAAVHAENTLKKRVERMEKKFADLGAFVQAAVKEMRQQEESLLGVLCLKCGEPVVYDFYCEPHLPPKIRKVYDEVKAKWSQRAAPE